MELVGITSGTGLASSESFTYDADSNVATHVTRKGDTIAFAYDTLNRLITKTPPSPAPVVNYAYDLDGRLTAANDNSSAIASAVPPSGTSVVYTTSYSYDALNRATGVSWDNAPAQTAPTAASVSFTHQYDGANQRTGQSVSDKSWWYTPPASASSTSYTANALDQYSAVGAVTPTYDGNGNQTSDGTFTYGYDAESRMTSLSGSGVSASYAHDAQGRRKAKTVSGTTTITVTDADNRQVLDYDGSSGAVLRWYAYGMRPNAVLNRMDVPAGTRTTFIPDIQNTIVASLDSGTGALTKTGNLAYGENPNNSSDGPLYTGQHLDAETAGSAAQPSGLYYYRARVYSPALGRFMQPDPIRYAGGPNLHVYVGNDPLNRIDPSGNVALVDNLIGAGVAIGVDLFAQYAQALATGQTFQVNYTRTAVAGAAGFVTSGASALLGGGISSLGLSSASSFILRTSGNAAIGMLSNVGATATLNYAQGNNDSLTTAAITGAVFGGAASALADTVPGISAALNQAKYNALSPGEKNLVNGIADMSGYEIGGASPAAVAAGQQVGNFVSSGTSFTGGESSANEK